MRVLDSAARRADDETVMVVGGYGVVGRSVCRRLAASGRRVVAAGRSPERATAFAAGVDGVDPGTVDLADTSTYAAALEGVDCVVVCVDAPPLAFVRACLDRHADYVDLSPTDEHLRAVEGLDERAREAGATAVLSVGLAPGATNLLAVDATAALDHVATVRIGVLLGIGERVGRDTYDWALGRLDGRFDVRIDGRERRVRAFSDPWTVSVPGHGRRRLYRYDLADQHALVRTTDVPSVGTWLCYDSRLATTLSALAARTGLVESVAEAVGRERAVDALAATADRSPLGGDSFVALAVALGRVGDEPTTVRRWVRGHDQGRATAIVGAAVAALVSETDPAPGVHHAHDLFTLGSVADAFRAAEITLGSETTTVAR